MATALQGEKFDFRKDWILKKDDQIHCGDYTYTIDGEPLGYGGSSVLYPATRSDSKLHYALKECFPDALGRFKRENGVVTALDEIGEKQLEQYIFMLHKEQEYGQEIRNTTDRAVSIWDRLSVQAITVDGKTNENASGAIITVMERIDRKGKFLRELLDDIADEKASAPSLRTGGLPHIYTTACIMEQILVALDAVHKAGYVFGDISPNNIFFTEYDGAIGNVGRGSLLDFGSARPLLKDDLTEEITDQQVFSTKGYVPPEMETGNNGHLRLGKQADIYSVGRLMMLNLLTNGKDLAKINVKPNQMLLPAHGKAVGCSGKALERTNEILYNALRQDPEDRYKDAEEMLAAIRELKKLTEPPKFKILSNLSSPDYYVPHSRAKEIAALKEAVNEGETVFIWGLGGIGKTEVAIKLAEEIKPTKGAYLIHFQTSMRKTVLQIHFSGYKYAPQEGLSPQEQEDKEYQERLDILRDYYSGAMIIVDNFDCDGQTLDDLRREKAFRDFLGLDIQRVFTTRYPVGRREWEIRELSDDKLLNLMRHYCRDSSVTDAQLLDLIHAVKGHTLTLTLIAKTLEESWGDVTPEMILEALRNSKLSKIDYPEVASDQNRVYSQRQIYEHLKALFDLSAMDDVAKTVLCCATLLPDDGMDTQLFKNCLHQNEQKSLQNLVKRGWITRTPQKLLMIHPVIREVCRGELKPSDEICEPFLEQLWKAHDPNNYNAIRYNQIAAVYSNAVGFLDDKRGDHVFRLGHLYCLLGRYSEQMTCNKNALSIKLQVLPSDHPEIAASYNALGDAYGVFCEHMQQLSCYLSALKIWEYRLVPDQITDCQRNAAYTNLDDYAAQLFYTAIIMQEQRSISLPDHPEIAKCCSNIGHACGELGDFDQQLYYCQKAMEIRERIFPNNHPDLAESYTNIGDAYGVPYRNTNYEEQLAFYKKALTIWKSTLPLDHPNIALSYRNIGDAYGNLGEDEQQLIHYKRALEIYEYQMPSTHPVLAALYEKMGNACNEDDEQLSYYLKASAIYEHVLPEYHPSVVKLYQKIADVCKNLGDYQQQLVYCHKYLNIQKKHILMGHIENTYNEIGIVYRNLGMHDQALDCFEKALDILEDGSFGPHPLTAQVYEQIGYTYMDAYDDINALVYFKKAISLWEEKDGFLININVAGICNAICDICYDFGEYAEAFHYCQKAYSTHDTVATHNLASMYLCGVGCEQDRERAIVLFQEAAFDPETPLYESNRELGLLYLGIHPDAVDFSPIDPQKALRHLEYAKQLGADNVDSLIAQAKRMLEEK